MLRMIGLIFMLTALVAPAMAQPVVVEFSGVMSEVTASTLDPSIGVGSTFEGSYSFDPASITSSGPSGFGGTGYAFPPGGTLELTVEGIAFASEIVEIVIEDDGPNGDLWGTATPAPDLPEEVALTVGFTDSTQTRLDSESFFDNVALRGWDGASIWFFAPSGPAAVARGQITGIERDPSWPMITEKIAVRGDPSASAPLSIYKSFMPSGPGYLDAFGRSVFGAHLDYQSSGPIELVRQSPGGAGEKIALEGEPAPGGGTFDVIFDQATNAAGDLVFASCIDGCPSSVGLFQQRDGILSRVAESGATAPGLPRFVFSDFQSPSINLAREIAFGARISGSTAAAAVYVRSDAGYTLLATDGDPAPGTGGGTLVMPGSDLVRLSENGDVAFSASVAGGTASWGIFVHRSSGLEAVALEGEPAPGTSGGTFAAPHLSGIDARGRVLFFDQLTGGASNQGLFLWHEGVVTPFVVSGDPAPDGGTFGSVGGSATITPRGDIAFVGIVGARAVVYVATSSGMEAVVAEGDSAPGTGEGTFSNPRDLSLNESGLLSFHSTISGGTTYSGIFFVPEPSRASMLIAGAVALVALRRRAG